MGGSLRSVAAWTLLAATAAQGAPLAAAGCTWWLGESLDDRADT